MKTGKVYFFAIIVLQLLFQACGPSYDEQCRLNRQERQRLAREDSAAFKVAVLPTIDCLPIFVAKYHNLYDTAKVDLRLKAFSAQMDCDTALMNARVEAGVTDLVRAERMQKLGTGLHYLSATGAYWQLIGNRQSRIKQLKQLDDKMMAMTRYSVTDMLGDMAVDSVKLTDERVFRVQINDVRLRLKMLENNEMDAMWLPEPQATRARMLRHNVIADSRKMNVASGAIVVRKTIYDDKARKPQIEAFVNAYNAAVDSIAKFGVQHYGNLVAKYCAVDEKTVARLPKDLKFKHMAPPEERDIEQAKKYIH